LGGLHAFQVTPDGYDVIVHFDIVLGEFLNLLGGPVEALLGGRGVGWLEPTANRCGQSRRSKNDVSVGVEPLDEQLTLACGWVTLGFAIVH
jgi:hypothetical protein